MNFNKKQWFVRPLLLVLVLSVFALPVAGATVTYKNGTLHGTPSPLLSQSAKEPEPELPEDGEMDWSNMLDDTTNENDGTEKISKEFTPKLVCENKNYTFWYDTTGADIYVRDKRDGHIWSNAVNDAYYQNEEAKLPILTQLLQVRVCDEEGGVGSWDLFDAVGNEDDFKLATKYDKTGMTLTVEVAATKVSFDVRFDLTEEGLNVSIPAKQIKQKGESKLLSIVLMPSFGAARTDESGYILMPDGSGALSRFNGMEQKEDRVYSYTLYGQSEQSVDNLYRRDEQDIKNMMLPLFGIRAKDSGFMAAITEGAENASVHIVPYGYQAPKLGRAYFTFMYLYSETFILNGKAINQVMSLQELSDRSVTYYLMDKDHCDYSDMAATWRDHLEDTGVLTTRLTDTKTAVSLDVFMGVNKNGLFSETMVEMTTFEQAQTIVSELKEAGVANMELTLQGWNDGGFTQAPTNVNASGALGGKRGLRKLTEWLAEENIPVYLYNDYFSTTVDTKTANLRKDVIRDYVSNMVTDSAGKRLMMNTYRTLSNSIASARKTGSYDHAAFSLARAGQWLWNCYERENDCTRTEAMQAIMAALEDCKKTEGKLQVYGGNQYVLTYANSLREIPDTGSGYYIATESVPFYQMVVSGYATYTSVAGNMTYDFDYQKLRWVEYGSTPYFILSHENAIKLIDSDYDRLFSSEYSVWKDRIADVYQEFSTKLQAVEGAVMVRHTTLGEGLSRVDYDNGYSVYVNYNEKPATVDEDVTIGAKDYTVIKTERGAAS